MIDNLGNDNDLDPKIHANDWTCDGSGSDDIDVGQLKWSATTGTAYAAMTPMTTTATATSTLQVTKRDPASGQFNATAGVWMILRMPANGVGGTCTNTVTITGAT